MLLERVKEYIKENRLIEDDERILVAFSGGLDSLALLLLLHDLRKDFNMDLGACHVNHMLRGKAADEDEVFCREVCRNLDTPFYSVRTDVAAYAREKGLSLEAAGREVRYAFFKETMVNHKYHKCATAHHLDDQAETILLNLMRGCGLNGLTGMAPERGEYLKPLLFLKKEELESYVQESGLTPREDESNRENIYQRNKVRNELVPYIQENFNTHFSETLMRMSELLSSDAEYLELKVQEAEKEYLIRGDHHRVTLKKEAFKLHRAILSRLLLLAISTVKGDLLDIEEVHIRDILSLHHKETGKVLDIKDSLVARNDYGNLIIERKKTGTERIESMLHEELSLPGTYRIEGKTITFRYIDKEEMRKDKHLRFFNGDLIEERIIVRHRLEGDRMRPFGMNGYRKLKNILIDKKISREDRETLLIFQNRNEVFYIGSMIISDDYKVKDSTQKILEIGIIEEENNDSK